MTTYRAVATACLAALAVSLAAPATGAGFVDVLDTPAQSSPLASKTLLQAVAKRAIALVAVGQRGHIVVSDDGGKTWKQSPRAGQLRPDGRVLRRRARRAGRSATTASSSTATTAATAWQLQLDGRKANDLLLAAHGAQGRGGAGVRGARRRCWPRRSATRSRAPTSRSSTSGSPTPQTATSSARTTSSSAPPTAARPGSRGSTGPTIPSSSISTRSARPAVISTSPAKAGSC